MAASPLEKVPNAVLDYQLNWDKWLDTDETITASTWTVSAGITMSDSANTDRTATVILSGGTAGQPYTATNQVTTSGGRTDERTLKIRVVAERDIP